MYVCFAHTTQQYTYSTGKAVRFSTEQILKAFWLLVCMHLDDSLSNSITKKEESVKSLGSFQGETKQNKSSSLHIQLKQSGPDTR